MEFDCKSFLPHHIQHPTHLVVLIAIAAVLTLILNPLLIYSLIKTKQTRTNTFRFIIAMSISDILLGAIVMPTTAIVTIVRERHKDCILDQGAQFGFYLFSYFSFSMLLSITFDRLYQLRSLRQSARAFSCNRIACILVSCLATAAVWAYISIAYISFAFQIALVVVNVCLFLIVLACYTRLIRKIRIHCLTVSSSLAKSNFRGVSARIEINASKVVWILLVTLIVTCLPFNIISPWLLYVKYEKKIVPNSILTTSTMLAYLLVFTYAFANALIFLSTNYRIRRFLWRRFGKMLASKQTSVYAAEMRKVRN